MPNLYAKFLKALYVVLDNAQPSNILFDLKQSAVTAFTKAYSESSIKDCLLISEKNVRKNFCAN